MFFSYKELFRNDNMHNRVVSHFHVQNLIFIFLFKWIFTAEEILSTFKADLSMSAIHLPQNRFIVLMTKSVKVIMHAVAHTQTRFLNVNANQKQLIAWTILLVRFLIC